MASTVGAGARLDRLPISRFHFRLLFLIGAGMFWDAFEIYLQGGVLASLAASGWSTPAQNANFISATFAGMVCGAWAAGILGDRFGRRFSYQFNLLIFAAGSLVAALAPSMGWLIVTRFVIGIGLGAEIVVGYVTLSEFVPPGNRGRWAAGLALLANSALFVSGLVGSIVIPTVGWRWMFVLVGVGGLAIWWMRKKMPESPRWLEAKGQLEERDRLLAVIEAEVEAQTGTPLPPPQQAVPDTRAKVAGLGALFGPALLRRTLLGMLLLVTMNTGIYGLVTFLPSFMVAKGETIASSLAYTTVMTLGGPAGSLVGIFLADRVGRRAGIALFSAAAVVFAIAYPFMQVPTLLMLDGFLLVSCLYVLVTICFALYLPELFPTEVRMRGVGVCNMVGRVATIATPQLVAHLLAPVGVMAVVAYVSALLISQAIAMLIWGVETRRASLEQIADGVGLATAAPVDSLAAAVNMSGQISPDPSQGA